MQSLLTSDDNGRCEAVAHNILKGFYFSWLDVLNLALGFILYVSQNIVFVS